MNNDTINDNGIVKLKYKKYKFIESSVKAFSTKYAKVVVLIVEFVKKIKKKPKNKIILDFWK